MRRRNVFVLEVKCLVGDDLEVVLKTVNVCNLIDIVLNL